MKVLLIEDNDHLRRSVNALLSEYGYDVMSVANGSEGVERALQWSFDIIILDIMMPVMDGWEAMKKIRETKETPIIMLTARDSVEEKIKALDLGADDYINKPFDIAELIARIKSVTRRTAPNNDRIIEAGGLIIDTLSRSVTMNNEVIDLTSKEFSIIEMFAFNQGKVITREKIYDIHFSDEDEKTSNILDVYIYKLRKKLGKDTIKTKRGYGYLFNAI